MLGLHTPCMNHPLTRLHTRESRSVLSGAVLSVEPVGSLEREDEQDDHDEREEEGRARAGLFPSNTRAVAAFPTGRAHAHGMTGTLENWKKKNREEKKKKKNRIKSTARRASSRSGRVHMFGAEALHS